MANSVVLEDTRILLYKAKRGDELIRSQCPKTQVWLLLNGEWTETRENRSATIKPADTLGYAPKEPCRRVAESNLVALSITTSRPWRLHRNAELSPQQWSALYRIAHVVAVGMLDPLILEEQLQVFDPEEQIKFMPQEWVEHAKEIIHSNPTQNQSVKAIADQVGISPNHLSTAFKNYTGIPISKYTRLLKLKNALASHPQKPNWLGSGFYDESHFYRVCRTELGLKPSQVRSILANA